MGLVAKLTITINDTTTVFGANDTETLRYYLGETAEQCEQANVIPLITLTIHGSAKNNKLDDMDINSIACTLKDYDIITTLTLILEHSDIRNPSIYLAKILEHSKTLRNVYVSNDDMDAPSIQHLTTVLANNNTLKTLALNSVIDDTGFDAIISLFSTNTTLTTLNVTISNEKRRKLIATYLERNKLYDAEKKNAALLAKASSTSASSSSSSSSTHVANFPQLNNHFQPESTSQSNPITQATKKLASALLGYKPTQ